MRTKDLESCFRPSRSQKRILARMNTYLNGGRRITDQMKELDSSEMSQKRMKFTPKENVKRNAPEKARQKRILRRIGKGKTVERGLLRDKPKSFEFRLFEGLKIEENSDELRLIGTEHSLSIKFKRVAASTSNLAEYLELYKKHYLHTFGYHGNNWHWNGSLLGNVRIRIVLNFRIFLISGLSIASYCRTLKI